MASDSKRERRGKNVTELSGAQVVARALQDQGINELFGLMGIPVVPVAQEAQRAGIRYIGTRHEAAAGYAAQAASYMSGHIGAALVVSGPGVTNAITTLGNAQENAWPMLLLGGSSALDLTTRGDFQESPSLEHVRPFVKWSGRPTNVRLIPRFIATAVREALGGRPGPVYIDLPGDVVYDKADESEIEWAPRVPPPPRPEVTAESVAAAIEALKSAESPLIIVGKGAAWSQAEAELREFVDKTQVPFLPTPMGKGVIPDDHPLSTAAARSYALRNADLVFLVGARLNWILHFGLPPRFKEGVRVIQLDIAGEEIGRNVPTEVPLVGDAKAVMAQLNDYLEAHPWELPEDNEWKSSLRSEAEQKRQTTAPMLASDELPMNYYRPLKEIDQALPRDAIIVSEGAKTMDISRQVLNNYFPRSRIDAGSWGTMGVGGGFALAAQVKNPDKRVIALEGDSAFGFDGMEIEVAARYGLPITWIIFNNNGIGGGPPAFIEGRPPPVGAYVPDARHDMLIEAFGGKGYRVNTPEELRAALQEALTSDGPTLIDVVINPKADRRAQEFGWWPSGETHAKQETPTKKS